MSDDVHLRAGATGRQRPIAAAADSLLLAEFAPVSPEGGPADPPAGPAMSGAAAGDAARFARVLNIPVRLSVELGRAEMPLRDVLNIDRGSIIELDHSVGQPLDLRVNGVLIGHGEIVVIGEERLGVRFVDVISAAERASRL